MTFPKQLLIVEGVDGAYYAYPTVADIPDDEDGTEVATYAFVESPGHLTVTKQVER
jgi:hypothetical protein